MKKFYLFVLGCQMNISDAERLRFLLKELGLEEAENEKEADIIVAIACSVKQKPIDRIWGKIKIWRSRLPRPKIILTGCVTVNDQKKFKEKFDLVFNIGEPQKLVNYIKKNIRPQRSSYGGLVCWPKIESLFALTPERKLRDKVYIVLGNGCNNFCTYCVVPYTRGRETYRSMKEILAEVKQALKNGARRAEPNQHPLGGALRAEPNQHPLGGAKVISLIAQNVNSYKDSSVIPAKAGIQEHGSRIKSGMTEGKARNDKEGNDFIDLLTKINNLSGDFKIEFLTSHPKDMSDELIQIVAKLDKVIKWIHLPVQAGSSKILAKMNRHYDREHYLNLVKKIRKVMPKVFLTTDIIVGFPSESKKDFAETVSLVEICQFDQAFISPYSPRSGTVASKMEDDVSPAEKKRRFQILDKLINKKPTS